MKTALLIYWLAVTLICGAAWLYLQHLGSFLHDALGGIPWPGITQIAFYYRGLFLVIPLGFAGAAIWLARSRFRSSAVPVYGAVCVLTITAVVSLLLLATMLALTMTGRMEGGRPRTTWEWLFLGW